MSSESAAELQMTATAVVLTASQAEPMESAAVRTTTAMNTRVRSVSATERIQAWTMTEIAAAEAIAPLVQRACRNRGRLCRLPQE
jgi:hypothetical protein